MKEIPVRIVYLLTSLGMGGAEKQTIALAERMAARGNAVAFIILKHAAEEWPVQLPVMRLNMSKTVTSLWISLRLALRFVSSFQAEILHSHTYPANIFARLLLIRLGLKKHKPLLINTIHNVYEGGRSRMLAYRLTSPVVDHVTAVSTTAADRYVRIGSVPPRKMHVLTNGIDTDTFTPDGRRRVCGRKRMLAGDNFIWLTVGRIAPQKDYPNLLRAFAKVRVCQSNVRLWIAGEGDLSSLFKELSDAGWAEDERVSSIRLLGLRRDVVDLMDAADGIVLSSAWEGMPLALGEAMAMTKPVVATDVGGVRELVGTAGVLVPPRDSSALAEAMCSVLKMPDSVRDLQGKAARDRIIKLFSIDVKALEWEAVYSSVLAGKSA